ncbi:ATP-binding cassette domain-containing protein [Lactiplantibacillus plantarum]
MFNVKGLNVFYDTNHILKDINFSIEKDDILAVIGPSGAGKTTLIKAITNLIPFTGEISMDEQNIDLSKITISLVPQDYGLLPWKTVEQNIYLANKIRQHKRISSTQKDNIHLIMKSLDIEKIAKKFPKFISGGQEQRVALARALSLSPDLLVLDEAFSALDPVVKDTAKRLFLKQWKYKPTLTLMVTHDLNEALSLSTKIYILSSYGTGKLITNPLERRLAPDYSDDSNYYDCLSSLQKEVNELWRT